MKTDKLARFLVSWLGCMSIVVVFCSADEKTAADKLDKMFETYDKRFRPNHGGDAVDVGLTAYVLAMPEIDSVKQELVLDLYFRQSWNDPRLSFQDYDKIVLDGNHYTKLWAPDTFFVNELAAEEHAVTVPNSFARISPNGDVLKSSRYTLRTSCPMNFAAFPFDEQTCTVLIESYAHSGKDLTYKWTKGSGDKAFSVAGDISHVEFKVVGHRGSVSTETLSSGIYTRAKMEILFRRSSGRYMIEFFYPCMFLVSLSIAALFVTEPRVSVIVNVMTMGFTILFLAISSGSLEVPFISYATKLDSFSSITNTFVFMSLLISIISLYLSKTKFGPETIELTNLTHGRVRLQNQGDEEATLCSSSSSPKPSQITPTRVEAAGLFIGAIVSKFLPFIKILVVLIYLLTILIFWTTAPSSQITSNEQLLTEDWHVM